MSEKFDVSRPLFLGPKAARENTTVDHIRRAVKALNTGTGVPYGTLEEHLLRNYTPGKSANYGAPFIKSYVRDAVSKYDYLSHTDEGHDYEVVPLVAKKAAKPKAPSKNRLHELEILRVIRDEGQVSDAGDVDNTQFTPEDIAEELGRTQKTVDASIKALAEEGNLRLESVDGNKPGDKVTYVYLTAQGYATLNEAVPIKQDAEIDTSVTAE